MNFLRLFSSASKQSHQIIVRNLAATQAKPVAEGNSQNKDAIRELRRRTGYSFSHIKKALEKHNYDISESEKWLKAEAKRLGWEKATGLASRVSRQGLVGVLESSKGLAMVELNCETDFVAKNKRFHNLLGSICHSLMQNGSFQTQLVPKHMWADVKVPEFAASKAVTGGSSVADLIASEVGHIGENIQLRRGLFWPKMSTANDSAVAFMVHPVSTMNAVVETELGPLNVGKYAAVVEARRVARETTPVEGEQFEQLPLLTACQQLAQHIIGMNPDKIFPEKKEEETTATEVKVENVEKIEKDGAVAEEKEKQEKRDDRALVCQTFVLDEDITVGEFLEEQSLEIVDFVRFEVGEQAEVKNA